MALLLVAIFESADTKLLKFTLTMAPRSRIIVPKE
jgi:hypothetical protein